MNRDPHYRLGWGFAGWRPVWVFKCNLCETVIASRDWRRRRHFSEWLESWPHYESTSGEWCETLLEEWIQEGRDREELEYGDIGWREKYPYNFSTGDPE
jgi:hypothetical protein